MSQIDSRLRHARLGPHACTQQSGDPIALRSTHLPTDNLRNVGRHYAADGPFGLLMAAQLPESRALP